MGKAVALALLLCGCQKKEEPPFFYYSRTIEHLNGDIETVTWTGPVPPPWLPEKD